MKQKKINGTDINWDFSLDSRASARTFESESSDPFEGMDVSRIEYLTHGFTTEGCNKGIPIDQDGWFSRQVQSRNRMVRTVIT